MVTSVPSDSPDDFQTLTDLRKKPEFYKIQPAWAAIDPVPVIKTPAYGELTAPAIVKQLKIQSQKDTKQLAEAKELAYKEGFYNGVMLVGDFKGESVIKRGFGDFYRLSLFLSPETSSPACTTC